MQLWHWADTSDLLPVCKKWKETYGLEGLIVWDSDSITLVSSVVSESMASGTREIL